MLARELKLRDYPYKSRSGLSERIAKSYFRKKGYEVFRGMRILDQKNLYYYFYPGMRKKHDRLQQILKEKLKERYSEFRKSLKNGKGLPDYVIHMSRKEGKETFFAEIKLEHESLKESQLECIRLLEKYGFRVVLVRVKKKVINEASEINTRTFAKKILVKQSRLTKRILKQRRIPAA